MKNKKLEDLLQKEYMRGFADSEKKYKDVIAKYTETQEKLKKVKEFVNKL